MQAEIDRTDTTLAAALFGTAPLVVLGRDEAGKPHASRFSPEEGPAARKAATLMGMATLEAEGDELAGLAAQLPTGKLFESGRAFVPFVKGALYEQLHDHLPKKDRETLADTIRIRGAAAEAANVADAVPDKFTLPEDWSQHGLLSVAMGAAQLAGRPTLAQLNDTFRRSLVGGRVVMTPGVVALGSEGVMAIVRWIATFDTFTLDNDPYGEHDFGSLTHKGTTYFWEIDAYDRACEYGSPDPSNPAGGNSRCQLATATPTTATSRAFPKRAGR